MGEERAPETKIIDPREYAIDRPAPIGLGELIGSVVRVGDGRGFIVAAGDERIMDGGKGYVITAAHCLPSLPPPHLARYLEEETYRRLIGPLGADTSVTATCV